MIGLDTTALIDLFRGDKKIRTLIETTSEPLSVCIISYSELMFGITGKRDKEQEEFYDRVFQKTHCFNLDRLTSKKASKIYHELEEKGFRVGTFDCLIAGIFLSNGVNKIITRNKKDFEKIKGIKVISY